MHKQCTYFHTPPALCQQPTHFTHHPLPLAPRTPTPTSTHGGPWVPLVRRCCIRLLLRTGLITADVNTKVLQREGSEEGGEKEDEEEGVVGTGKGK